MIDAINDAKESLENNGYNPTVVYARVEDVDECFDMANRFTPADSEPPRITGLTLKYDTMLDKGTIAVADESRPNSIAKREID